MRGTVSEMHGDWWNACGCTEQEWVRGVDQQVGRGVSGVKQNGQREERDM